jgi:hypothetical protein
MLTPFTYNVNNTGLTALNIELIYVTTITYNDDR